MCRTHTQQPAPFRWAVTGRVGWGFLVAYSRRRALSSRMSPTFHPRRRSSALEHRAVSSGTCYVSLMYARRRTDVRVMVYDNIMQYSDRERSRTAQQRRELYRENYAKAFTPYMINDAHATSARFKSASGWENLFMLMHVVILSS